MKLLIFFTFFAFFSQKSFSLSFPIFDSDAASKALENPFFTENYDFNGIVALSNCSGSLVRFENSKDDDLAMVLTNGHCVSMMGPSNYYYQRNSFRMFRILDPGGATIGRVRATKLIYATMTTTDIGLYQLKKTYSEIESDYQASPLTLSSKDPLLGDPIEIISGYWVRGYSCSIEHFAYQLKEAGYIMNGSMRYSRPGCEVIGGTSGSPAIAKDSRIQIGINNTGNESGRECSMNNPCEIDEQGNITYEKGWSYAQRTTPIYSCLNESGVFDLNTNGCLLPGARAYEEKVVSH